MTALPPLSLGACQVAVTDPFGSAPALSAVGAVGATGTRTVVVPAGPVPVVLVAATLTA